MADPAYIVDGVLTDGEAWVALDSETLTSPASSITFASTNDGQVGDWSQYMDLVIIAYAQTAASGATYSYSFIEFNNDTTAANYDRQTLEGDGASATAAVYTTIRFPITSATAGANVFGAAIAHLFDINSGKYKSVSVFGGGDGDGSGNVKMYACTWKNQAAITEIDIWGWKGSYDLSTGSRFDLFGILPRMVA
jgi:hypothetical protein